LKEPDDTIWHDGFKGLFECSVIKDLKQREDAVEGGKEHFDELFRHRGRDDFKESFAIGNLRSTAQVARVILCDREEDIEEW
jgi:hypothetical protein